MGQVHFSALERAGFDLRYVPMNSLYKNKLMHDEMDIRPYIRVKRLLARAAELEAILKARSIVPGAGR